MRGHGSLQQMLGKKITGAKKKAEHDTPGAVKKKQNKAGSAGLPEAQHAAAGSGVQQKLSSFFRVRHSQPCSAPQTRSAAQRTASVQAGSSAHGTVTPSQLPGQLCHNVYTRIVGRQHQDTEQPPPWHGEELLLVREPDNPVDPCAILVCSRTRTGGRRAHGHLPASVASHLAPLLDAGQVEALAQLSDVAAVAATAHGLQSSATTAVSETDTSTVASAGSSLTRAGSGSQWRVSLTVTVVSTAPNGAASDITAALESAAAAGIQSLEPGRNNGAVLVASFEHILQQARQHDLHLLDEQEQAVLHSMQTLPPPGKNLLLRLLLRKRTWFQLDSLAYPDIPDCTAAAHQLAAAALLGWSHDQTADLHSLLPQLPVGILRQLLTQLLPRNHPALVTARSRSGSLGPGASGDETHTAKTALVASLQSCTQTPACWARLQSAIKATTGDWLTVLPVVTATFSRLQHLYFLTPGQDLGMFLAVDRGVLRYPCYAVARQRPVFASRQDLLEYEQALTLAARVEQSLEEGDTSAAWQLLQPALAALKAGSHKAIIWQEQHGAVLPNPSTASQQQQQQAVQQSQSVQQQQQPQLRQLEIPQQQTLHKQQQQHADVLRSPSPRPAFSNTYSPAHSRSRSRSPSPSSNRPSSSSSSDTSSSSCSWSSRGFSQSCTSSSSARIGASAPAQVEVCTRARTRSRIARGMTPAPPGAGSTAAVAAAAARKTPVVTTEAAQELEAEEEQEYPCDMLHELEEDILGVAMHEPLTGTSSHALHQAAEAAVAQSVASKTLHVVSAAGADRQTAQKQQQQLSQVAAAADAPQSPPPLFLVRFCAAWVHASLGTVAVSILEKQKKWQDAVELLRVLLGGNACVGRRGEWWERLAINLEHLGLHEQALEAVEASLADSWVRWGDRLGLQRRLLRLGKPPRRWKRPSWAPQVEWEPPECGIVGRPLNCTTGTKSRFYGLDGSQVSVEQLALQHYASEEGGSWQGLHCEGGVWATLFGLLLWDVLFMGVPDVFRSPFQVAPLDLGTDAFYHARREQLDRQLSRIADGEAGSILSASWSAHCGVMCRGVNWQRFDQAMLLDICDCVGGLGLAAVLRLMAEDLSGASGGLPDLLLWRPADRSAKVVEVKGPRDRLSHQQRFWLAHMANSNLQVEVCKVREPNATSRAKKCA